jgi:hypothetical protein
MQTPQDDTGHTPPKPHQLLYHEAEFAAHPRGPILDGIRGVVDDVRREAGTYVERTTRSPGVELEAEAAREFLRGRRWLRIAALATRAGLATAALYAHLAVFLDAVAQMADILRLNPWLTDGHVNRLWNLATTAGIAYTATTKRATPWIHLWCEHIPAFAARYLQRENRTPNRWRTLILFSTDGLEHRHRQLKQDLHHSVRAMRSFTTGRIGWTRAVDADALRMVEAQVPPPRKGADQGLGYRPPRRRQRRAPHRARRR